jgi:hypothetical protein
MGADRTAIDPEDMLRAVMRELAGEVTASLSITSTRQARKMRAKRLAKVRRGRGLRSKHRKGDQ